MWRRNGPAVDVRRYGEQTQRQLVQAAALRYYAQQARGKKLKAYYYDLPAFLYDCVEWPAGRKPTEYQIEIASALYQDENGARIDESEVAEYGPHGIGKTALAASIVHHFSLTSDEMEEDWKCITTAGANTQLKQYLWPEIHIWAGRLKWNKIGREPYNHFELQEMSIKLRFGRAFAVNSANFALVEGAHAKRLLYLYDEAKAIRDEMFDASEGAFSNVGTHGYEAYKLAMSTPGEESGRFWQICTAQKGYGGWKVIHVNNEDVIKAGMRTEKWVERRKAAWGEDSQLFVNRVLGNFASKNETGIIPVSWVELAFERWREWALDAKGRRKPINELGILERIGVDIAWEGDDKSAIASAFSQDRVYSVDAFQNNNPMQMAGRVHAIRMRLGGTAVVDVIGIGAGVYSRLEELGDSPIKFNAAENPGKAFNPETNALEPVKDRLGEFGFVNKRAHAWWQLREKLDPEYGSQTICLPPSTILLRDLTTPRYRHTSSGNIQVEEKKEIKRRLKRSTDYADAVIQALYEGVQEQEEMTAW